MADVENVNNGNINDAEGEPLYESLFAETGSREMISISDWLNGWPAIVGGINGIPTSRQFNTLQYITDLKIKMLYLDLENFKKEVRERLDGLTNQGGEIVEIIKPLIKYTIMTDQDIEDIIDGVYEDDMDYQSLLDIVTNRDINNIIAGTYEEDIDEERPDILTNADIEAILSGTYIDDEDPEEYDLTEEEVKQIVDNTFNVEDEHEDGLI